MNITFKQLRMMQALVETKSISAAAKVMHVTQPTASMQLKEMSLAIGMPLYEVIGKKIFLTDIGLELASTAQDISRAWESFEQTVHASKGVNKGRLRIAVVSTAKYFMPKLIASFCKKHPAIDVSLEILNRDGVLERLRSNRDDLYIMSMPPQDVALEDVIFMPNPIGLIAASSNTLAKQKMVSLNELKNHRFILREPGSGTRMAGDQFFTKKKFKPNIRLELGSNEGIKEAVAGGLGIGIVSLHALHGHLKEQGVSVVNVEGFPVKSAWHLVHLSAKQLSPVAQAFKQHMLLEIKIK
jgi:DNA-binding transcriptional LysR family regulator